MASGQIKRSEIAEKDLYVEIRDSAKKTITTLNQLNVELKKSGTIIKTSLTGNLNKTTAGINKLSTAVKKAETVMAQSVKVDKAKSEAVKAQMKAEQELEKLNQAKQKTIQAELRTKTQLNKEQERQTNLKNKAIKAVKDEDNAYKRLVKTTRDQKNESKRLGAELLKLEQNGKKNTTQYRKLSTQFRNVTNSAKKGDKSLKKLDKTVGDNFRNVGNYRGALGKLSGAFASLGIAMGGAMIIKNVFGVIKDFDQAQANLASVLGVSRDQMKGLTEQSKELGATTRFTASQVSELQLEFAKLGFEQEQIEKMTGSVLDLAGATGAELGESASIVGATMRGFGLDASETQRVTDVMAKSFSSSSLDMSKFSTAMASVAPVAKLSGKSIEETTALIGTLTDRGIDASTAGTGLRNMFLKSKKAGLTFDEALEKINTSTDKSATAMELFGVRGATLGVVLAENGKDVENLTGKLKDAEGATAEMAEMQKNTLAGSLDLLQSAWEGMILSMDEAGGVGEKLRKGIRFLADNFGDIVKWVGKIVQAMIAYKTVMIAIKIANSGFVQDMIKVGKAMVQTARGTKGAITGIKGVGKAMKGIGLGVAIGLLLELAKAFYDIASGASEARRQQDLFNESQEKASELVEKILKEENERIEAQRKILELKKADKTNNFGELEFSKEMQLLEEGKLNRLERARKFREKEINDIKEQNKLLKEQAEKDLERLRSGGAGQGTGSAI